MKAVVPTSAARVRGTSATKECAVLILTRRIGETIYIGDTICLTVYDKLCFHVILGVLAPPGVPVLLNGMKMRGVLLGDGAHFYLLTLLSQDQFRVGEASVRVSFKPTYLGMEALRNRQIKIGVDAPKAIEVDREEIHHRKLVASGRTPPTMPVSAWLRDANLSVSCRAAA
jgi:sRNA-binding carbon storage regulator CsrA